VKTNICYIKIEHRFNIKIRCILTQISLHETLVIVDSVTTCRGWGHIEAAALQAAQLVLWFRLYCIHALAAVSVLCFSCTVCAKYPSWCEMMCKPL